MKLSAVLCVLAVVSGFWVSLGKKPQDPSVGLPGLEAEGSWLRCSWVSWVSSLFSGPADPTIFSDFDKYLDYVVVEYAFSSAEERSAFQEVANVLVADVWLVDGAGGQVCIGRTQLADFDRLLPAAMRDSRTVVLEDVHRAVLQTYPLKQTDLPAIDFVPIEEIYKYLESRSMHIGSSWEGRALLAVGAEPGRSPAPERTLVVCGVQGRDWAAVSACLALVEDLPPNTVVIPVANPDGYQFTWTSDRLWAKNRQPTSLVLCTGHNLKNALTGDIDPGATPCTDSWTGQGAQRAIEAHRIRDYASQFAKVIMVQGTARSPQPVLEKTDSSLPLSLLRLPDYGTGLLIPRRYLAELHEEVRTIITGGTQMVV